MVDFATRLPPEYKLRDGVGKQLLKKVAEPYLDHDIDLPEEAGLRRADGGVVPEGDFGTRCLAAFERSPLVSEGFLDRAYFTDLLRRQMAGSGGYSFHLWTVMNAVLWHASWIEGRVDCL